MAFTACEEIGHIIEPKDGDWAPMKWSHDKYETVKVDGVKYYSVPVEGGTYEFRCKNYGGFWLSDHWFDERGEVTHSYMDTTQVDPWNHYQNQWCTVDAEKATLRISFGPNHSTLRKAGIGVTAGDIFDRFQFCQQPALYTTE